MPSLPPAADRAGGAGPSLWRSRAQRGADVRRIEALGRQHEAGEGELAHNALPSNPFGQVAGLARREAIRPAPPPQQLAPGGADLSAS